MERMTDCEHEWVTILPKDVIAGLCEVQGCILCNWYQIGYTVADNLEWSLHKYDLEGEFVIAEEDKVSSQKTSRNEWWYAHCRRCRDDV